PHRVQHEGRLVLIACHGAEPGQDMFRHTASLKSREKAFCRAVSRQPPSDASPKATPGRYVSGFSRQPKQNSPSSGQTRTTSSLAVLPFTHLSNGGDRPAPCSEQRVWLGDGCIGASPARIDDV